MKIYISGKITGLDLGDARAEFDEAAAHIAVHGHEPVNPMEKVSEQRGLTWEQYMCEDIAILFECDAIFLLQNWQDSKSAQIERHIMQVLRRPIFYQESVLPEATTRYQCSKCRIVDISGLTPVTGSADCPVHEWEVTHGS